MNKKTKFTRVAVSGATIDNREITAQQINEMAESYNISTYKANIWMEHLRSAYPGSDFGCYGHVLSLKAEDYEVNGTTQRALYAELEITPELMAWNEKNQKKGFSIEIAPNFAKTNKAYLSGLAVTDSPASLGTESLQFNIQVRKEPEHLFTTALEFTGFDYAEGEDQTGVTVGTVDQQGFFKNLFAGFFAAQQPIAPMPTAATQFNIADLERVLTQFATKQDEVITGLQQTNQQLSNDFNALKTEFEALKNTPAPEVKHDFVAGNGTNENFLADC